MISEKNFQQVLEVYREHVPFEGTITSEKADELLEQGKICRGWIIESSELEYFHIIKSSSNYPKLTILVSEEEEQLLGSTFG